MNEPNQNRVPERRAKIICTLGPATNGHETIRLVAEAGMDIARLNFSHGSRADHQHLIDLVRQVSEETGKPIGILEDLQGPKIRVGKLLGGKVELKEGSTFRLVRDAVVGDRSHASVSFPGLFDALRPSHRVLLDDGRIELRLEAIDATGADCRVVTGGVLSENKGVNLPDTLLQATVPTPKDVEDLAFGLSQGVDFIGLSFVQTPADVESARREAHRLSGDSHLIAKIERPSAVTQIEGIAAQSDAIMVARGDLGVELPPEEVPPIQKQIIKLCNRMGRPVITATQMLESMIHNPRPTRAEASDVANAILDGSDAVMLSAETAVGEYPVEAVRMIASIVGIAERRFGPSARAVRDALPGSSTKELAVGYSACTAADIVDAVAIVCLTQSGATAARISQFRPTRPILAFTPNLDSLRRMTLLWGVTPFILEQFDTDFDRLIAGVIEWLRERKIVASGQNVVFTAGLPFVQRRNTNVVRIEEV